MPIEPPFCKSCTVVSGESYFPQSKHNFSLVVFLARTDADRRRTEVLLEINPKIFQNNNPIEKLIIMTESMICRNSLTS